MSHPAGAFVRWLGYIIHTAAEIGIPIEFMWCAGRATSLVKPRVRVGIDISVTVEKLDIFFKHRQNRRET